MRRRRLFSQDFAISVEAALRNLSDENFDWRLSEGNRSGHSEELTLGALQESCGEGEIILGSKGACQVTQFPSNSEGKITCKHEYLCLVVVVTKCIVVRPNP